MKNIDNEYKDEFGNTLTIICNLKLFKALLITMIEKL